MDRATMMAYAVNKPAEIETRRRELRARLRNDPSTPEAPKWTSEEMRNAAQRLLSSVLAKLPS